MHHSTRIVNVGMRVVHLLQFAPVRWRAQNGLCEFDNIDAPHKDVYHTHHEERGRNREVKSRGVDAASCEGKPPSIQASCETGQGDGASPKKGHPAEDAAQHF